MTVDLTDLLTAWCLVATCCLVATAAAKVAESVQSEQAVDNRIWQSGGPSWTGGGPSWGRKLAGTDGE
jgi:hypothetical protein